MMIYLYNAFKKKGHDGQETFVPQCLAEAFRAALHADPYLVREDMHFGAFSCVPNIVERCIVCSETYLTRKGSTSTKALFSDNSTV